MMINTNLRKKFHIKYGDFMMLVELARRRLEKNATMRDACRGAKPVEWHVVLAVSYLARGLVHHLTDHHNIDQTTTTTE